MKEREVEQYLKQKIEDNNGMCLKFTSPGNRGVPDRLCIMHNRIFFVELKKPTGVLSALQKRQIDKITKRGHACYVCYCKNDVNELLTELGYAV